MNCNVVGPNWSIKVGPKQVDKLKGRESKAEIIVLDGIVTEIRYSEVAGRAPLAFREMQQFQKLVSTRADDIVRKWIDFFVLHKSIKPERITGRLK